MKNLNYLAVILFAQITNIVLVSAKDMNGFEIASKEIKKNIHGAMEVIDQYAHGIEKQIYLPF